jgi:hypothetical protein
LFPGRNANHLKNRWYKVLVKRSALSLGQSIGGLVNGFRSDQDQDEYELFVADDFSWSDDASPSF